MRRIVSVLLLSGITAFHPIQAAAPADTTRPSAAGIAALGGFDPLPPREFIELAERIATWIIENSPYEDLERLPAFVKLPRATLNYAFFSQFPQGYQAQTCVKALYAPNLVLIGDDFDFEHSAYVLVHELVHHFRFQAGISFRRPEDAEIEAYRLQTKWVEEFGIGEVPCPLFMRLLMRENPHDYSRPPGGSGVSQ